jgi:hypothetical protein
VVALSSSSFLSLPSTSHFSLSFGAEPWLGSLRRLLRTARCVSFFSPCPPQLIPSPHQVEAPVASLLSLPAELLHKIFAKAYTNSFPPTGPINRALLPYDREHRFYRVETSATGNLRKLAEVVKGSGLGRWIKEVRIQSVDSPEAMPLRDVSYFFAFLPRLSVLELDARSATLRHVVLRHQFVHVSLYTMTRLSLEFNFAVDDDAPFNPSILRLLPLYPFLTSLSVAMNRSPDAVIEPVKLEDMTVHRLPNIETLVLCGDCISGYHSQRLFKACSALRTVILDDASTGDFCATLHLLPETLTHLELRTDKAPYTHDQPPSDALFLRFPSLRTLYLGEGTFGDALFSVLCRLPLLTSLGFGEGAYIPAEDILAFVNGPSPLLSLKTLTLDIVRGKRGWTIWDHGNPPSFNEVLMGPGWECPRFDDNFLPRPVQEAIWSARKKGVAVEGTVEDACSIELDFHHEMQRGAEVYGAMTGDWERVRLLHGDMWTRSWMRAAAGTPPDSEDDSEVEW